MNYFLRFVLDKIHFAVPIEEVREIARPKSIRKQNGISKNILGIFELRSEKVPLFNLPAFLDAPTKEKFEVIISEYNETPVGFIVDKVLGVVSTEELLDYPAICTIDNFFSGVIIHSDSLIQVLSLTKIMSPQRMKSLKKVLM